jgi:cell division protein ZapA (FtsZ GTPase activity inhibitor)
MTESEDRRSVTVRIAGDEHTLRTSADPEYTRRCAELVDERITQILHHIGPVPTDRAAILAALSLADEWLQAEDRARAGADTVSTRIAALTARIEAHSKSG